MLQELETIQSGLSALLDLDLWDAKQKDSLKRIHNKVNFLGSNDSKYHDAYGWEQNNNKLLFL